MLLKWSALQCGDIYTTVVTGGTRRSRPRKRFHQWTMLFVFSGSSGRATYKFYEWKREIQSTSKRMNSFVGCGVRDEQEISNREIVIVTVAFTFLLIESVSHSSGVWGMNDKWFEDLHVNLQVATLMAQWKRIYLTFEGSFNIDIYTIW